MGLTVAVSNGTTDSWLTESLTVANIREPQSEQSQKLVTGFVLPQCMGTTEDACLRELLVRILEQTSATIQGVKVANIARDHPHQANNEHYAGRLGN